MVLLFMAQYNVGDKVEVSGKRIGTIIKIGGTTLGGTSYWINLHGHAEPVGFLEDDIIRKAESRFGKSKYPPMKKPLTHIRKNGELIKVNETRKSMVDEAVKQVVEEFDPNKTYDKTYEPE